MSKMGFCAAAVFVLSSSAAFGGVIDFSTLTGANLSSFSSYMENGFTVTSTTGTWDVASVYGNPEPDILLGPIGSQSPGSITITDGGGAFAFSSFDLSSNNGSTGYTITGYLGGSPVFTETGTDSTATQFVTLSSTSSASIDTLVIALNPTSPTSSDNVDNIAYTAGGNGVSAVPEPATFTLFALGLAGAAALKRARRRKRRV